MLLGGPHPESLSSYVDSLINIIKIYGSKCKQEALERIATPVPVLDPAITGERDINLKEREIIDYVVLYPEYAMGHEIASLESKIKVRLAKGWELYGFPFDSETLIHQAMVKYE